MWKQFEIKFSAAEVEERTKVENGILALIKANEMIPPGKLSYTHLLCEKIIAALPNSSRYCVTNGFKPLTNAFLVCYIKCSDHDKKSSVRYKSADHILGQELTFQVTIKCDNCLRGDPAAPQHQPQNEEEIPQPLVEQNFQPQPQGSRVIRASNPFSAAIESISVGVSAVLTRIHHECSITEDPFNSLTMRAGEIPELIKESCIRALQNIGIVPPRRLSSPPHLSPPLHHSPVRETTPPIEENQHPVDQPIHQGALAAQGSRVIPLSAEEFSLRLRNAQRDAETEEAERAQTRTRSALGTRGAPGSRGNRGRPPKRARCN